MLLSTKTFLENMKENISQIDRALSNLFQFFFKYFWINNVYTHILIKKTYVE